MATENFVALIGMDLRLLPNIVTNHAGVGKMGFALGRQERLTPDRLRVGSLRLVHERHLVRFEKHLRELLPRLHLLSGDGAAEVL